MAKRGKGIGPAPIIAVAIVSTIFAIFIDHIGITHQIQKFVERFI
jgi:hypothetical protein